MRRRVVRHPLGGGYEPVRAAKALTDRWTDAVWLDSGDAGLSVLATGRRIHPRSPVMPALRRELEALGEVTVEAGDLRSDPAFAPGLVGWLGYELRGETTGAVVTRRASTPDAALLVVERAVLIDGRTGEAELVALAGPAVSADAESVGDPWADDLALAEWRAEVTAALDSAMRAPFPSPRAPVPAVARRRDSTARYLAEVAACQRAIRDGEAYQLCLTTEIEVDAAPDAFELYLRVRSASPSHHGALLRIGDVALVSASPERFLGIGSDGTVTTSPIKGTRRRSVDGDADAALAAELLASDKERAENVMIVDLMRNDLSRVCDPATVEVTSLLQVESYAQVHQLVSTVRGSLRAGVDAIDAVTACFPAGSMTGAPKRRATELLDALEERPRGLYAGAFGYLGVDGAVDLAMTIRSIVLADDRATIGTGGGITALSDPEAELEETAIKAAPLLAALGARIRA